MAVITDTQAGRHLRRTVILAVLCLLSATVFAERIKDLAFVQGVRNN